MRGAALRVSRRRSPQRLLREEFLGGRKLPFWIALEHARSCVPGDLALRDGTNFQHSPVKEAAVYLSRGVAQAQKTRQGEDPDSRRRLSPAGTRARARGWPCSGGTRRARSRARAPTSTSCRGTCGRASLASSG